MWLHLKKELYYLLHLVSSVSTKRIAYEKLKSYNTVSLMLLG